MKVLLIVDDGTEDGDEDATLHEALASMADVTVRGYSCDRTTEPFDAIVLSGSEPPDDGPPDGPPAAGGMLARDLLMSSEIPCLGVSLGMHRMVVAYGGRVSRTAVRRDGERTTVASASSVLLEAGTWNACYHHRDVVTDVPSDFRIVATSDNVVSAIESVGRLRFGVQFHPELSVLTTFLTIARQKRVECGVRTLPLGEFLLLADLIGRRGASRVARERGMDMNDVMHVWHTFRRWFNIPAQMV